VAAFGVEQIQNGGHCHGNQVCEIWSEFKKNCILVTMATAAILIFFSTPKAATHYSGYSSKVS
jgi:hypothetical protein